MEISDNNLSFLSNKLHDCFFEIFNYASKNKEYIDAIAEMTYYFADVNNDYDFIISKYPGINKQLLIEMMFSNFLEINYYRLESKIEIDEDRLYFIDKIVSLNKNSHALDLIFFSGYQMALIINDVLLYFWHLSPIYSYNAVMSLKKRGFSRYLYNIYPLARMEHSLTMMNEFSDKEYLLFTLYECIVNENEKYDFKEEDYPSPDPEYLLRIKDRLYKMNGKNDVNKNIYKVIIENFINRCHINEIAVYKSLMVEMCRSLLLHKEKDAIPYEDFEKDFMNMVKDNDYTEIYDKYKYEIISVFLDNLGYVDTNDIINSPDAMNLSLK